MTTTPTQQPKALQLADRHKERIRQLNNSWNAKWNRSTEEFDLCAKSDDELRYQHAEIARLTAENEALKAKMELVDYVLQDDIHNRLTPRVVDIAYSAFTVGRRDTPHDWFNDTKPMLMEQLSKIKKHLAEEAASRSDMADAYCGAREDLAEWKRRALEAEEKLRAESAASSRLVSELNAENGPMHMGEPVQQRQPLTSLTPGQCVDIADAAAKMELSENFLSDICKIVEMVEVAHGIVEKP